MFDMAIVNSWLLHKRDASSLMVPKTKMHRLCIYKLRVSTALIEAGKVATISKCGRPSMDATPEPTRKVFAIPPMPVED